MLPGGSLARLGFTFCSLLMRAIISTIPESEPRRRKRRGFGQHSVGTVSSWVNSLTEARRPHGPPPWASASFCKQCPSPCGFSRCAEGALEPLFWVFPPPHILERGREPRPLDTQCQTQAPLDGLAMSVSPLQEAARCPLPDRTCGSHLTSLDTRCPNSDEIDSPECGKVLEHRLGPSPHPPGPGISCLPEGTLLVCLEGVKGPMKNEWNSTGAGQSA